MRVKIVKSSSKKYDVYMNVPSFENELLFVIKKADDEVYIVRYLYDQPPVKFSSLAEAKAFVRSHKETWSSFLRRHTYGKTFENKSKVNDNMKSLGSKWRALKRAIRLDETTRVGQ